MNIHHLHVTSFRAHSASILDFPAKVTVLSGANGAGKTNILEAIHYLAMSKSFLGATDATVLQRGQRAFEVKGEFESDRGTRFSVHLGYTRDGGKRVLVNRSALDRISDLVGRVPIVTYAPSDIGLTAGGPEERRRFLDHTLSQARPAYLDALLKYRRTLKQRSALLGQSRRGARRPDPLFDVWTEELLRLGARIVATRGAFVSRFTGFLDESYRRFADLKETPQVDYRCDGPEDNALDQEAILEAMRRKSHRLRSRELELGRTLVGPHLDDLIFRLGGLESRRYASRGQHRTLGMALKLAASFYLHEELDEQPILLLDEVTAELDGTRIRILLDLLASNSVGQSLLTTASPELGMASFNPAVCRRILIREGRVEPND